MNKRIDFTILGGLPYVQETFDWMQDSYRKAFTSIAQLLGDKVIVSGCQVVGGNVTDGWITYNGELVRFVGSAYAAGNQVIVVDDTTSPLNPATYGDNTTHTIYYEKLARIGGPGGFPFTDLKPANIGVPVGTVLMWSGNVANMPAGFALCDGANGTPNLKGMFIAGYDAADADYNAIGKTGGRKAALITKNELPNISLQILGSDGTPIKYGGSALGVNSIHRVRTDVDEMYGSVGWKTEPIGNGVPLDIRPSYYTLAYIIKL